MTSATVIVPSRGGANRLPLLLDCLQRQEHTDLEVIVVLDGDIDDSQHVLARYPDLSLRSIVFDHNQGQTAALNAGLAAAEGAVLIRCDDDFEPAPGHVGAHVAAHESQDCGAIGLPRNVAPDSTYLRAYGADADARGRRAAYDTPVEQRWRLWGGNTSISRAVYEQVGGFDPRYRGYGWEDVDLGYRIHHAGYPIVLLPDAEVRHHMASVTTATRAQRAFWSGQARNRFEQIHGPGTSATDGTAASLWGQATNAAAKHLTERRVQRLSAAIDTTLRVLPTPVARKAVAFAVESAGEAGFRQGPSR